MDKTDILIFLSDQHDGRIAGFAGDPVIRTPNLDRLATDGTTFASAYTSCPLCVPARMSMLAGQLPSRTRVFDNAGSLCSDQATFLHAMAAIGYETVLCGRMHFEGFDQRHGFSKRIAGDITNLYPGNMRSTMIERKKYGPTLGEFGCTQIIGGGNSPTLEYDRYVVQQALDYLAKEHKKPQIIIVGTYAPHFPYVAPPDLYQHYLDRVTLPASISLGCDYTHPVLDSKQHDFDEEIIRGARAAYWGMIEFMDQEIGQVRAAWNQYLKRTGRDGVFIYLSDHGDQVGDRGLFGKKTFFESSAHIPLIFAGTGIPLGQTIKDPVSIMDLGPTLCEMAETKPPPEQDGISLYNQIIHGKGDPERAIISEYIDSAADPTVGIPDARRKAPGRMLRFRTWKLITYHPFEVDDLLFDLSQDPDELNNVAAKHPDILDSLRAMILDNWDPELQIEESARREAHLALIAAANRQIELDERERWKTTPAALDYPEHYLTSKAPIPERFRKLIERAMKA